MLSLATLTFTALIASAPPDERTWSKHADVVAVRAVYRDVERGVGTLALRPHTRERARATIRGYARRRSARRSWARDGGAHVRRARRPALRVGGGAIRRCASLLRREGRVRLAATATAHAGGCVARRRPRARSRRH